MVAQIRQPKCHPCYERYLHQVPKIKQQQKEHMNHIYQMLDSTAQSGWYNFTLSGADGALTTSSK